jgi:hypothetical protein
MSKDNKPEKTQKSARRYRDSGIPKEWLKNRITLAEAEFKHAVDLESRGYLSEKERTGEANARRQESSISKKFVPFGYQNAVWRTLVESMQEGDELWEYCSSDDSWEHLAGRAGIALVRNGEVIDSILTVMN